MGRSMSGLEEVFGRVCRTDKMTFERFGGTLYLAKNDHVYNGFLRCTSK